MNRIIDEFRKDDERILDRLVDGELTEADRKVLLGALDDEPGAWRRCALAFLEAQSWRNAFSAARSEPQPTEVTVAKALAPAKPSRFFETCLAIAASVMVAFGIGVWIRGEWQTSTLPMQFASDNANRSLPAATVVNSQSPWHRAKVNFNDAGSSGASQLEVPVVESSNVNPDWLKQHPSALPADVEKALQNSGHRVTKHRTLVPVRSDDGRLLLMPVEQVDVEPEKRPAY
jgi:hypothetical protein